MTCSSFVTVIQLKSLCPETEEVPRSQENHLRSFRPQTISQQKMMKMIFCFWRKIVSSSNDLNAMKYNQYFSEDFFFKAFIHDQVCNTFKEMTTINTTAYPLQSVYSNV